MAIDVFKDMNPEQREAIGHLDGPLLVIAGAGSGKTRVITHRIAHIIQAKAVRPDRILAITFTNKAAGEMKERVHRLIGLQTPWITTFHSAGLRFLKQEAERLGFEHPFTVLDQDDQVRIYRRIIKDNGWDPKAVDAKKVQSRISAWKNDMKDIAAYQSDDEEAMWAKRCWEHYARICRAECQLDFDDLLVKPVELMERDPDLRAKWVERFPYILIDEFQDTNTVQYRLVKLLGVHRNVCATGDPDQAIYGWRGADLGNILTFEQDFQPCRRVLLETNYRSTKIILRAAQGVVANNERRMDKTIRTNNADGERIRVLAVDDEADEAFAVAAAIDRMRGLGRPLNHIAVFYRISSLSRTLEDALRRRDLPHRIIGGLRYYDRAEIKDVLAYLRLMVNPADRTSLARIANVPRRGLGPASVEKLFTLADDEQVGPMEVLERDDLLDRIAVGRAGTGFRDLARIWRMLRVVPKGDPVACVRAVLGFTSIEEHYVRDDSEEESDEALPGAKRKAGEAAETGAEKVANVREMVNAAVGYREAHADGGLNGFLEHVALVTSVDQDDDTADQVRLMTLHAAKGLEFPVVFIVACEQGIFPLMRGGQIADLEEERRLMYVGITRAMEELYLSRARQRRQWGETARTEDSQFLLEIPADCFTDKDASTNRPPPPPKRWQRGSQGRGSYVRDAIPAARRRGGDPRTDLREPEGDEPPDAQDDPDDEPVIFTDDPFRPGDRIVHDLFGQGRVERLTGSSGNRTLVVRFERHGRKELAWAFAKDKILMR